jgi:hypothetical protein
MRPQKASFAGGHEKVLHQGGIHHFHERPEAMETPPGIDPSFESAIAGRIWPPEDLDQREVLSVPMAAP